mmetsp:Transcript_16344/g.51212  ORF Transcript_16344/g.51212 Transcript_16344/m.51212 type:complete len:273 (-) Transcript_16344:945-1763(-)
MRFIRSSRILPLTISPKVALSIVQISAVSLVTLTVAVLRSSKSKARSPKHAFRPCVRTRLLLMNMETSPREITYMEEPQEPCSITSASLVQCWSLSADTTLSVCSWLRCRKTGTFRTNSILAAYSAACSAFSAGLFRPRALTRLSCERTLILAPSGPATKSSSLMVFSGTRPPALRTGDSTPSLPTMTLPRVSASQQSPRDTTTRSPLLECLMLPVTTITARTPRPTAPLMGLSAGRSFISMACITADCCARANCEKFGDALRPCRISDRSR